MPKPKKQIPRKESARNKNKSNTREHDKNEAKEPIKVETLEIAGQDEFGGTFAFAYDYAYTLNAVSGGMADYFNKVAEFSYTQLEQRNAELGDKVSSEMLKQEIAEAWQKAYIRYFERFMELFKQGMEKKLRDTLTEHVYECGHATRLELDGTEFSDNNSHGKFAVRAKNRENAVGTLIRANVQNIKQRIKAPLRGGSKAEYDWSQLSAYYRQQLPRWQDAKDSIYTPNSSDPRWRKWVKSEYPDFDEDLIEWLSSNPKLPENILSEGRTKGMTSTPSDIAIMHSARLCGSDGYPRTIRRLHQIRKEQESTETHS